MSPMTTQSWMAFFAFFAAALTVLIGCERWLDLKVTELFAKAPSNGFDSAVHNELMFWGDLQLFLHRFRFVVANLAALLSFTVAARLRRVKVKPDIRALPLHHR